MTLKEKIEFTKKELQERVAKTQKEIEKSPFNSVRYTESIGELMAYSYALGLVTAALENE